MRSPLKSLMSARLPGAPATDPEPWELPVYPRAVLGWRSWIAYQGVLMPTRAGAASLIRSLEPELKRGVSWGSPTDDAFCTRAGAEHPLPQTSCECGWHAWREPVLAVRMTEMLREGLELDEHPDAYCVWGAVAGSGKICAHHLGWRAQRAQILGIVSDGVDPLAERMITDQLGSELWVESAAELTARVESLSVAQLPVELSPLRRSPIKRRWMDFRAVFNV